MYSRMRFRSDVALIAAAGGVACLDASQQRPERRFRVAVAGDWPLRGDPADDPRKQVDEPIFLGMACLRTGTCFDHMRATAPGREHSHPAEPTTTIIRASSRALQACE